jgi:hypothetical protein
MKKILPLLLLILFVGIIGPQAQARTNEFDFIEKNADVVILIKNDPNDTGFQYVTNLWRERFEIKETTTKNEAIEELYAKLPIDTLIGAAYLPQEAFDDEDEPIYPDFIVIAELKSDEENFKEAMNTLLKKRKPLKKVIYEGYEITYRDKELEPYHGQKDLAAYVQVDDYFLIGMEPGDLYKAIDVYKGNRTSFKENKGLLRLLDSQSKETDTFFLVNNQNNLFSKNLKRWEEREGIRVLLSSESIDALLFSLDLATDDAVKGQLIFMPKEGQDIISIEDDACFFEEIINRSFVKQDINWTSEVKRDKDNNILLSFEGTGFKRIWEEALLNKRVAFIEEERAKHKKEQAQTAAPTTNATGKFIKVIFVSVIAFIVLVAVILFKGRN